MGDPGQPPHAPGLTRWRVIGMAAAIALAAASWGAGSRATLNTGILWPGLERWSSTGGSPLLATLAILAMGVLVWAWWQLRDAAASLRWWRVTTATWFLPLVASVPLYSRDLYSYAAQGALWAQGVDPYEHGVSALDSDWKDSTAPTWLDSTVPYGPVWLALARLCATLARGDLVVALILLRVIAILAVVVMAWAVPELARRLGHVEPSRALWLGVAAPLVGAHFISGAHNDALMVAGILTGLVLALRARFVLACLVLALAAMVKVTAIVVVPFVVLLWAAHRVAAPPAVGGRPDQLPSGARVLTWLGIVRAGAFSLLVTAVPILVVSVATGLGFGWLNPTAASGKNEQWTSLPTGLGMAVGAIGHLIGHDEWRDTGISVARTLALGVMALVLVLLWLATARRAADRVAVVRASGLALVAVVVLGPAFLGWYSLWILPILAVTISPATHRRTITWLAVVATLLCFAQLPDGYSLGLTTTAVGVPIVLVATALLLRAAWRWWTVTDWRHFLDLSGVGVGPRTTGHAD